MCIGIPMQIVDISGHQARVQGRGQVGPARRVEAQPARHTIAERMPRTRIMHECSARRERALRPSPPCPSSLPVLDIVQPLGIVNHMVLDKSPRLDTVFHALAHPARRAIKIGRAHV